MLNVLDAREKVCKIIYDFMAKLYSKGVSRDRELQFAMAILCKAKGQCNVLKAAEEEMEVYNFKSDDIKIVVTTIQEVCGDKIGEILPACADIIIEKYSNGPWGESLQPRELSKLVLELVKTKNCKTLYNPFAGLASYAIADFIEEYYGQELNFATCNIAKMRLELNGIDYSHLEHTDSIKGWNDCGADCIVSTPPFGSQLNPNEQSSLGASTFEEFVLRRFLLSDVPYAFFVVNRGFCNSSGRYYNIRKEIVDKNVLDMVIDMPVNIFSSTSIATSILVLSKKRDSNSLIKLIDGSNCMATAEMHKNGVDVKTILDIVGETHNPDKAEVLQKDIVNNDYNCTPQRYTLTLEVPDGYVKVAMSDIATLCATNSRLQENGERGEYITEPTILISQISPNAEYVMASSEKPIFIKPSRYIKCQLDESKIDRDYFLYKYNHLDTKVFKAYMVGATIRRFTLRSLSVLQFCIPESLQGQRNALVEAKQAELEAQVRESGLETLLEQKKREYMDVIRTRKHDMKPYVRELGSFERMIRHYLSQKNDMPNFSEKMNALLDKHNEALTKLSALIDVFSEEDKFGKAEPFNIDKYFNDMEINHDDILSGYSIEYYCDDNALQDFGLPVHETFSKGFSLLNNIIEFKAEFLKKDDIVPLLVYIAPVDFERMVSNILENAKTHGFTDSNRSDYAFWIDLTVNSEKSMYQIDFFNNGNPLPTGMDKNRYGLLGEKAGVTSGTGRGGYVVKSIVEHYHGEYDVFMDGENTVIRVLLPIYKRDGE